MNEQSENNGADSNLNLLGFALADCVVELDRASAKYLRAVHRTALELATPNCFGAEIGGFWLMQEQLVQLRKLPDFYSQPEAPCVARAVEAYLLAQTDGLQMATRTLSSLDNTSPSKLLANKQP